MKSSRKLEFKLADKGFMVPQNGNYKTPGELIGYQADYKGHLDNRARMKRMPISSKSYRK